MRWFLLFAVAALVAGSPRTARTQADPVPGWTLLGDVRINDRGCAKCPATFKTPQHYDAFSIATDTPYPISLVGSVWINCSNEFSYEVFLGSPTTGGIFQVIGNSCVNLETRDVTLTVKSVSLWPTDEKRTVGLVLYGRLI